MKLIEIKTARELGCGGSGIEFVKVNEEINEVIIHTGLGEDIHIRQAGTYSANLKVFKRQDHTPCKKFNLSGSAHGVVIDQLFDEEQLAVDAKHAFEQAYAGVSLQIKEIEVLVDEDGQRAREADSDIPY